MSTYWKLLLGCVKAGNGRLVQARFEREGPQSVTVSVPNDFPYGTYLLWAENTRGCSRPVRVNATEAWWVGPNRARPGARVGLYSRNLSHRNADELSYIYLRPWTSGTASAASTAMTVVSVNPAPGTYEVWAHNGHGGDYGWSGPVPLVVDAGAEPQWTGQRRDVTSFGANPAETGDDTAAFVQAFQAARNGDTIVIRKGVYRISAPLALQASVSVEGEAARSDNSRVRQRERKSGGDLEHPRLPFPGSRCDVPQPGDQRDRT